MKNTFKSLFFLITFILVLSCKTSKENKNKGLKEVANFPIGTAIRPNTLLKDSVLQELQKRNFNSITAASAMKMYAITRGENQYNWSIVDKILEYAEQNNQRLFGHNLIWHSSTPNWVKEKAEKDSIWLKDYMKEYITSYVTRYKGKVDGWDVVNEGFESAGGEYRKTFWYNNLGKEYIENAFIYAHEADPEAVLFYNDFNIERDTLKLNAVLEMVKDFKERNIPIHGIGFQMHIRMDISDEIIANSLRKAAATGLQIHLSEVDIIFNSHDDTQNGGIETYTVLTDEMKENQKEKYKNLVKMYQSIVPKEQQYGITFWDFTDRDTWIRGFFKMKDWPTIFDDSLKPKPAYFGVLEGLEEYL